MQRCAARRPAPSLPGRGGGGADGRRPRTGRQPGGTPGRGSLWPLNGSTSAGQELGRRMLTKEAGGWVGSCSRTLKGSTHPTTHHPPPAAHGPSSTPAVAPQIPQTPKPDTLALLACICTPNSNPITNLRHGLEGGQALGKVGDPGVAVGGGARWIELESNNTCARAAAAARVLTCVCFLLNSCVIFTNTQRTCKETGSNCRQAAVGCRPSVCVCVVMSGYPRRRAGQHARRAHEGRASQLSLSAALSVAACHWQEPACERL